jgi:hypothetical protein
MDSIYKVLVYCITRRDVLEEEIFPFEGTCSPEELAISHRLEEIDGVINYIVENCK